MLLIHYFAKSTFCLIFSVISKKYMFPNLEITNYGYSSRITQLKTCTHANQTGHWTVKDMDFENATLL